MNGYVGRLAPSPTGALHLGNARTFMIAWLRARACGGKVVFRMEDLDHPRDKPGAAANQGDIGMGKDGLNTCTKLGYNLSHTFASLSKRGAVDIGLRGNATHVQTRATNVVGLENNDFQALLGGIFSSAVATRSCADDENISGEARC